MSMHSRLFTVYIDESIKQGGAVTLLINNKFKCDEKKSISYEHESSFEREKKVISNILRINLFDNLVCRVIKILKLKK